MDTVIDTAYLFVQMVGLRVVDYLLAAPLLFWTATPVERRTRSRLYDTSISTVPGLTADAFLRRSKTILICGIPAISKRF